MLRDWSNPGTYPDRVKLIAGMVKPGKGVTRVIEFGCGITPVSLYLPADCHYQGSDLIKRDDNTIVIDLNKDLPVIARYNVAVFSGVLEYINDIPRVIAWITPYVDTIIASYAVSKGEDMTGREYNGWINNYTFAEFDNLFFDFVPIITKVWHGQAITRYDKTIG